MARLPDDNDCDDNDDDDKDNNDDDDGDDGKRNAWQGLHPSSRISSPSVHLFNLIVIKGCIKSIIIIGIIFQSKSTL